MDCGILLVLYDNWFKQVKTELCKCSPVQLRQTRANVREMRGDTVVLNLELSPIVCQKKINPVKTHVWWNNANVQHTISGHTPLKSPHLLYSPCTESLNGSTWGKKADRLLLFMWYPRPSRLQIATFELSKIIVSSKYREDHSAFCFPSTQRRCNSSCRVYLGCVYVWCVWCVSCRPEPLLGTGGRESVWYTWLTSLPQSLRPLWLQSLRQPYAGKLSRCSLRSPPSRMTHLHIPDGTTHHIHHHTEPSPPERKGQKW